TGRLGGKALLGSEWIRIAWIRDHISELTDAVVPDHVLNRSGPGAVIEGARATTNHGFPVGLWSESERTAGPEVVVVVKVVLPVVAKTERGRQSGANANLVLNEEPDHFF